MRAGRPGLTERERRTSPMSDRAQESELVKKVAKVLAAERRASARPNASDFAGARSILQMISDPTDAMIEAAFVASGESELLIKTIYATMIQSQLRVPPTRQEH